MSGEQSHNLPKHTVGCPGFTGFQTQQTTIIFFHLHCTLTKSLFGFPILVSKFSKFSISSVEYVYIPKTEFTYSEPTKCEY